MPKPPDSAKDRMARFRDRMRAAGFRQTTVWIPNTQKARDDIAKLAAKLRGEK